MENNWIILIVIVFVFIAVFIIVGIKNHKDRKTLFKKLPGDYPDPKEIKSEFDGKD